MARKLPGTPDPLQPPPSVTRGPRWLTLLCVVLLLATFLNYANRFVLTQNALPVQAAFRTNEEGYGALAGWFGIGFAIGGLLFGFLADRLSVRWLYPVVVAVWSLAGISSGLVTDLFGLSISQFVLGLFEAGHWPCALRSTQRAFLPAQRTWGNSLLQSGASLGAVATPLLVVAIHVIDPDAWRWGFYIVGVLGLPWLVLWLVTVSDDDVQRPVIQTDETSPGAGKAVVLQEMPFWRVFTTRRWWLLLLVVVCINTLWHYVRVWLPVMLEKDHRYSHEFVGVFTSLYYLATFFGSIGSGGMTTCLARCGWNVHRARMATFLLFGLLSSLAIPAAFMPGGWPLLSVLLLIGFGSLGLFPVYYSLNQEISAKNQGKVGGTLGFSTWALLALLHPQIGRLVDANPAARPFLFAAVGFGPLLAFAVLALFWGKRQDSK